MSHAKRLALSETYEEVRLLICKITNKIVENYRFDDHQREELEAEARLIYAKAYESYDPDKGTKFSTYIYFKVDRRLRDWLAKRGHPTMNAVSLDDDTEAVVSPSLAVAPDDFMLCLSEELSEDALHVARLVIDPPKGLHTALRIERCTESERPSMSVRSEGFRQNCAPRAMKALHGYLSDCGWSACRILESFAELQDFLRQRTPADTYSPVQRPGCAMRAKEFASAF